MTNVTLSHNKNIYKVVCKGHATGSVEVCAAVSALIYALVGYADSVSCLIYAKLEEGDAEVEVSKGAKQAFEMMSTGFMLISRDYPEFLSVNWAESETS